MLRQRIITALILVSCLVFAVVHPNVWVWRVFVGIVVVTAWWEWLRLANMRSSMIKMLVAATGFILALFSAFAFGVLVEVQIALAILWLLLIVATLSPKLQKNSIIWSDTAKLLVSIVSLTFFAYGAIWLQEQAGPVWLLLLAAIIWIADIGAYFTGKRFGKRKLAATVSPGKSIEGALGGLVLVSLYVCVIGFTYAANIPLLYAVIAAIIIAVVSIGGDLYESWLKRQAGIKDSGSILPGHGGVLDRIDSLLAAMPFMMLSYQYYQYMV